MSGVRSVLVLGGTRSGKSRFAEGLVTATGLERLYVATAEARDDEMAERVARHRAGRGEGWRTIEEPLELPDLIREIATPDRAILVDCLTLWLSNWMEAGRDAAEAERQLADAIAAARGPIALVSNEVGSGIVPINALARRFESAQGRLNQAAATAVASVFLVVAGQPLRIKPDPNPGFAL